MVRGELKKRLKKSEATISGSKKNYFYHFCFKFRMEESKSIWMLQDVMTGLLHWYMPIVQVITHTSILPYQVHG